MRRLPLESPSFGLVSIGASPVVSLHTPAWQCTNSYVLTDPAPKRRNNQIRPNHTGVLGGPGFADEWSVELEIAINGSWGFGGGAYADENVGEETNWRWLVDNLYNQTPDDQGRLPCVVTSNIAGYGYLGLVQMTNFRREPIAGASCAYLEVTLPSGGLLLVAT